MSTPTPEQLLHDLPEGERPAHARLAAALAARAASAGPSPAVRTRLDARFRAGLAQHIDARPAARQPWGRQVLSGLLGVAVASAAWMLVFVRTLQPVPGRSPNQPTSLALREGADQETTTRKERDAAPADTDADAPQSTGLRADDTFAGRSTAGVLAPRLDESRDAPPAPPQPAQLQPGSEATAGSAAAQQERLPKSVFQGTLPTSVPRELPVYLITGSLPPTLTSTSYPTVPAAEALGLLLRSESGVTVEQVSVIYHELLGPDGVYVLPFYEFVGTNGTGDAATIFARTLPAVRGPLLPDYQLPSFAP